MTNKKGDDEKLKELILFLARESEGDANFGAVKLNKELFYSDFLAYLHHGKSITGHDYIALERGPAPKYKMQIILGMVRRGELAIRKHEAFGGVQDRAFALREPNLDKFSKDEIQLVHHVVRHCHAKSGKDLSAMSHAFLGWRLAKEKEIIPYSVALIGTREPTLDEIKWGQELEPKAMECLGRYERRAAEA
jgi:antitoxin SocA-like protein